MAIMMRVHKNSTTEKQDIINFSKAMNRKIRRQLFASICINVLLIAYILYKIKH